ncbi:MAG: metalloregulator ArsR/SmtB family transcription factor [Spirochaeta sp.]|nr:metalloregulator ArsR/SmtB family transcription factor [Spirochaeta sp.]
MCRNSKISLILFSNEARLKILCLLNEGEFCVHEIVDTLEGKYSNISQQLRILSLAGYVDKNRQESHVYYRLKDNRIKDILEFLHNHL